MANHHSSERAPSKTLKQKYNVDYCVHVHLRKIFPNFPYVFFQTRLLNGRAFSSDVKTNIFSGRVFQNIFSETSFIFARESLVIWREGISLVGVYGKLTNSFQYSFFFLLHQIKLLFSLRTLLIYIIYCENMYAYTNLVYSVIIGI